MEEVFSKSKYNRNSEVIWHPDHDYPYVIHCEGHPLDGRVIIWPEAHENSKAGNATFPCALYFMTNREHCFGGTIKGTGIFRLASKKITTNSVWFDQGDGYGSPALLKISPMSDEEFRITKEEFRQANYKVPVSKKQLVEIYVHDFED